MLLTVASREEYELFGVDPEQLIRGGIGRTPTDETNEGRGVGGELAPLLTTPKRRLDTIDKNV